MGADYHPNRPWVWRRQADAVLTRANPASGTPYGVGTLATAVEDVRIYNIAAWVTWTVQPNLEVRLVVDGNTINHLSDAPVSTLPYFLIVNVDLPEPTQYMQATTGAAIDAYRAFIYEGQSIQVFAETTGGTVQNLDCRIKWARLLPT